jgi:hypothetical protein
MKIWNLLLLYTVYNNNNKIATLEKWKWNVYYDNV